MPSLVTSLFEGVGVKRPLGLDILQKLYYLCKEIVFAYILLVNLWT